MSTRQHFILSSLLLIAILATFTMVQGKGELRSSRLATANNASLSWNLVDKDEPLLTVPEQLRTDQDLTFSFPFGQFAIPLTQSLHYNAKAHRFLLMLTSDNGRRGNYFELLQVGTSRTYVTQAGPKL